MDAHGPNRGYFFERSAGPGSHLSGLRVIFKRHRLSPPMSLSKMPSVPSRTFPSGDALPLVGFGTWDLDDAVYGVPA